jgi:hypothetical protein
MRLRVALLPILTAAIASGIAAADIEAAVRQDARYQPHLAEGLRWAIGN